VHRKASKIHSAAALELKSGHAQYVKTWRQSTVVGGDINQKRGKRTKGQKWVKKLMYDGNELKFPSTFERKDSNTQERGIGSGFCQEKEEIRDAINRKGKREPKKKKKAKKKKKKKKAGG